MMDSFRHVFWVAFLTVVLAEIGCFFRTAALVEKLGFPLAVCLGTLLANAVILFPIWIGGEWLHRSFSPQVARWISGSILLLMGLLILIGKEL